MRPHRFSLALVSILVLTLMSAKVSALTPPMEYVLRYSIMRCNYGFVGRVVTTRPYSTGYWNRESSVVVDTVVFGEVAAGDTVTIGWRSDECENPDGRYSKVLCGGETQLLELAGRSMLWLVAVDDLSRAQVAPLEIDKLSDDRLIELASIADGSTTPVPRIPFRDADALESDPSNLAKCERVSRYLRQIAESK